MIIIIEFWRKSIDRIEYSHNKIFLDEDSAKSYLRINRFWQIDELTFERNGLRAIITERKVE